MELVLIKFGNYSSLDGLQVEINRDLNFIVGENNIGKSNFQNGLVKALSAKSFRLYGSKIRTKVVST